MKCNYLKNGVCDEEKMKIDRKYSGKLSICFDDACWLNNNSCGIFYKNLMEIENSGNIEAHMRNLGFNRDGSCIEKNKITKKTNNFRRIEMS
jgi:hypothetical protein